MSSSERISSLTQQAQSLVKAAKLHAVASFTSVFEQFPSLRNVSVDDWDFFVTIAGVYIAVTRLRDANINEQLEDQFMEIVGVELEKWDKNGIHAFEDCKSFFERTYKGLLKKQHDEMWIASDSIGTWIVWNIMKRQPAFEEMKLVRSIGVLTVNSFYDWWNG